jgi:hypothetical protein
MRARRVRIKLVDERVRPGRPMLHPHVCDFVKYSYGSQSQTTDGWESEPWTVAQFPMSRKEQEFLERRVDALDSWEEIEADTRANPGPPGPDVDELGVLKRLPDGGKILEVPPRKPKLMLRWEKVTPMLDRLAMSLGYLSPDGIVLKDGDAKTLTISELRAMYNASGMF